MGRSGEESCGVDCGQSGGGWTKIQKAAAVEEPGAAFYEN